MGRGKSFKMGKTCIIKVPEAMAPSLKELVRVLDGRTEPIEDVWILIKLLN